MPADDHNLTRGHSGFDHSRNGGVTQIVHPQTRNPRFCTRGSKGFLRVFEIEDHSVRPAGGEDVELFEFGAQPRRDRDNARFGGLRDRRAQANHTGQKIHVAPFQTEGFAFAHGGIEQQNQKRAQMLARWFLASQQQA